jgi:hypothetical protein
MQLRSMPRVVIVNVLEGNEIKVYAFLMIVRYIVLPIAVIARSTYGWKVHEETHQPHAFYLCDICDGGKYAEHKLCVFGNRAGLDQHI